MNVLLKWFYMLSYCIKINVVLRPYYRSFFLQWTSVNTESHHSSKCWVNVPVESSAPEGRTISQFPYQGSKKYHRKLSAKFAIARVWEEWLQTIYSQYNKDSSFMNSGHLWWPVSDSKKIMSAKTSSINGEKTKGWCFTWFSCANVHIGSIN